ncbi:MAG: PA2778 family cysteine peptidase [Rhodoferax sp.]|nr:PA2778 family cysteine peptidase [Rhodoferax sp.]
MLKFSMICFFVVLAGCAQFVPQTIQLRSAWPADVPRTLELREVPFFAQTAYQCGPAALAMVMDAAGAKVLPDELVDQVYLPARHGSLQVEMLTAPRRHGLVGWQVPANFDALLRELGAGRPVLVLQNLGMWPFDSWHYAVVVGFNYQSGELYLRSGETERLALPFTIFEVTWRRSGYWAMVVVPPEKLPATATEAGYLQSLLAFERAASPVAARDAWNAFLSRWPTNVLASVALSNQYYRAREFEKAEAILRPAAQKHPSSAEVLNNLSQVLSDMGRNEEALALIDRATALKGVFETEIIATREGILRRLGR